MQPVRRALLAGLSLSLSACLCAYDYDKESVTERIVSDADECPRTGQVAFDEGAHEATLEAQDRIARGPLCWYRLATTDDRRCGPLFAPFATLDELRASALRRSEPDKVATSNPDHIACSDEGPVVVVAASGTTCSPVPDATSWEHKVEGFDDSMTVEELLAEDPRSTLRSCVYNLVTEHHKPSCTSSQFWY